MDIIEGRDHRLSFIKIESKEQSTLYITHQIKSMRKTLSNIPPQKTIRPSSRVHRLQVIPLLTCHLPEIGIIFRSIYSQIQMNRTLVSLSLSLHLHTLDFCCLSAWKLFFVRIKSKTFLLMIFRYEISSPFTHPPQTPRGYLFQIFSYLTVSDIE